MMAILTAIRNWLRGCPEVDPMFDVKCDRGHGHDNPGYHRCEGRRNTVQWRTDGHRRSPPPPPPPPLAEPGVRYSGIGPPPLTKGCPHG